MIVSPGCRRGGGNTLRKAVARLFYAGEQGVWYDYSDFNTMFQDSAGTTPVTAVGQPVGKVLDKSGRGNHATQATATSRPLLQQDASGYYYLSYDGVDDGLATSAIDFTASAQITAWAGVSKQVENSSGTIAELSVASDTNGGSFFLRASGGGLANYQWNVRSATTNTQPSIAAAAPDSSVLTLSADLAAPATITRRNGAQSSSAAVPVGGGNFGNYPLYIGRRAGASLPFNGRLYSLIVRGAASSAAQIASAERYVGSRMGISL